MHKLGPVRRWFDFRTNLGSGVFGLRIRRAMRGGATQRSAYGRSQIVYASLELVDVAGNMRILNVYGKSEWQHSKQVPAHGACLPA